MPRDTSSTCAPRMTLPSRTAERTKLVAASRASRTMLKTRAYSSGTVSPT
jgi:hypothetical protein